MMLNKNLSVPEWKNWLSTVANFSVGRRVNAPLVQMISGYDDRPYMSIDILGSMYRGLLDSGSEISIINSALLEKISNEISINKSYDLDYVITANGSKSPVSGYVNLPVTVGAATVVVKFYVVPGIAVRLLLGINFWQAFNIAPEILSFCPLKSGRTASDGLVSEVKYIHGFDSLSVLEQKQAEQIIGEFEQVAAENKGLGCTPLITHKIDTGDAAPIKQRYYMMSPSKLAELNRQLDEMLENDVVEPSSSPWNSPVTIVPKADGTWRFCLDSRKLNAVTKHDAYPLPYITHILDQLGNAKYLSSIDLKSAYWQVKLADNDSKEKTAFTVPSRGLFQFKRMCFGLTSASATQQRLMDLLFGPEYGNKIFRYLDDVVVVSASFEEHIRLLRVVLERLRCANLTINLSKCRFFRKQLKYLGYVVDEYGLRTDPDKVKAIVDFPTPRCRKDVKSFLGTASYYRRFIKNFSQIAGPLNALTTTRKGAPPFVWSTAADKAFHELKRALSSAPVLACPNFSLPFTVHCDASSFGVGGTLTQEINGEEHPVAYCSRSLSSAERNYSATEREALAVVFVVEHFRPYLEGGEQFKIITDHASLKWFLNLKNPSGRLERWGCRLSPYNFVIEHRRGKDNVVPDALSRSVPVALVDCEVGDPWYLNIFKRVQNKPESCPNFQIQEGRLFRYTKSKTKLKSDFEWKEVIPFEKRQDVISENHCHPKAAHLGTTKTYKRMKLRYYWPGMFQDTKRYVSDCTVCKSYKHANQSTPGFMGSAKVCSRPFQCISIDLVGPLPSSRLLNTYLLVVVCCFSKYCLLFPLRRATGKVIAQRLEDHVFLVHGVPQTVIVDNGSQFTGLEVRDLLEKYQIPQIHYSPVYCPQVNTVERYNRTIVTAIASFVGSDHRTWDSNIHKIQFALNTAENETTSYSPFFLVHGREAVPDGNLYTAYKNINEIVFDSRRDYVDKLGELKSIFDMVKTEISKAHERNAKYYNKHRRDLSFEEGDFVWKKSYKQSDAGKYFSSKLAPKYVRCKVVKKLSRLVYVLEDENGRNLGKWHVKDLKSD